MNRRDFISKFVFALPVVAIVSCTKKEEEKKLTDEEVEKLREGAQNYHQAIQYVKEEDPIAKTLGYVQNAEDADPSLRKEKSGIPGEDQYCHNCIFFVEKEGKNYGECQLLRGRGMVRREAWCKSWAPKPEQVR